MKYQYLIIILFLLFALPSAQGQQAPFSQFNRYNWQIINPAAIDRMHMFKQRNMLVNFSYRDPWSNADIEGSPVFYQISFELMPSPKGFIPIKWGFNFFNDQTDKILSSGGNINGAYYFRFRNTRFRQQALHIGISVGAVWNRIKVQEITFKENDPLIGDNFSRVYPDVGLGVFYRDTNRDDLTGFYCGFSIPKFFDSNPFGNYAKVRITQMYLIAGGFITFNDKLTFEPSTWIRHSPNIKFNSLINNSPFAIDLNLRMYHLLKNGNFFWLSSGYGTNKNIKTECGLILEVFEKGLYDHSGKSKYGTVQLGFGYEFPVGKQTLDLGETFEISVVYGLSWKPKR